MAAFASALPGVWTGVICTGSDFQTIRIDERGNPLPVSRHEQCLFAHAADMSARIEPAQTLAIPVEGIVLHSGNLLSRYAAAPYRHRGGSEIRTTPAG